MIIESNTINQGQNSGLIKLYNRGAFVASTTLVYKANNEWYTIKSPSIPVMQEYPLYIPQNAQDINFMVDIAVYFAAWRRIYYKHFNAPVSKCYVATGITLYANCYEVPCYDIGGGNNNGCCCDCTCNCNCK